MGRKVGSETLFSNNFCCSRARCKGVLIRKEINKENVFVPLIKITQRREERNCQEKVSRLASFLMIFGIFIAPKKGIRMKLVRSNQTHNPLLKYKMNTIPGNLLHQVHARKCTTAERGAIFQNIYKL